MKNKFVALTMLLATPAGAQTTAVPATMPATAAVDQTQAQDPATTDLNRSIQARLDAVTAQNQQAADGYAKQMADFNQARAEFDRAKAANDADRAAAAAALAEWKSKTGGSEIVVTARKQPVQTASANPTPHRVCRPRTPTIGTLIARSGVVCRTVAETKDQQTATDQTVNAMRDNMARGTNESVMAPN